MVDYDPAAKMRQIVDAYKKSMYDQLEVVRKGMVAQGLIEETDPLPPGAYPVNVSLSDVQHDLVQAAVTEVPRRDEVADCTNSPLPKQQSAALEVSDLEERLYRGREELIGAVLYKTSADHSSGGRETANDSMDLDFAYDRLENAFTAFGELFRSHQVAVNKFKEGEARNVEARETYHGHRHG